MRYIVYAADEIDRKPMLNILQVVGRRPIHPFPARMAPAIALDAMSNADNPLVVLDPMMGSGTVLAVARANGHRSYGFDVDPLAVLISRVWTTSLDPDLFMRRAGEVLARASRVASQLSARDAYPAEADRETKAFLRYWFNPWVRVQLKSLSLCVGAVKDPTIRSALWCAFSRLIITKNKGVSLARDLSHSRPHRAFATAPIKPFDVFLTSAQVVATNSLRRGESSVGPRSYVRRGDARRLGLAPETVDLIVTSPPYLNAIDYIRCSKFSLVWMGYRISVLRNIRAGCIGAELQANVQAGHLVATMEDMTSGAELSSRHRGMLLRYLIDLELSMKEIARVLRTGGKAVLVVGDSTLKGCVVSNSTAVQCLSERAGLILEEKNTRDLPANRRYLPPPTTARSGRQFEARMRREVVMKFSKPKIGAKR